MTYSETEKAEAGLQLAEEIMDAFEHDGWPGIDYIIDMIAKYEALTVSAMPKILAALGWSGGTVEQVVAEVGRLKAAKARDEIVEDAVLHVEIMNALDENFGGHSLKQIEDVMTIFKTVWRNRKPLGQGVAALLPEHGEVKP